MFISDRLKIIRKERGLSQSTVAENIGIAQQNYARYENGRIPRIEQLVAIADFYDVSVDYLVGRSDDPTRH